VPDGPAQHGSFDAAVAVLHFRTPGGHGHMPLPDDSDETFEHWKATILDVMPEHYRADAEVWRESNTPEPIDREDEA
jgi:hypothetical protein